MARAQPCLRVVVTRVLLIACGIQAGTLADASGDVDEAFDLLLGALANQGRNPAVVQRGEFSWEERTRQKPRSTEEVQRTIADRISFIEQKISGATTDQERQHFQKLRVAVGNELSESTHASTTPIRKKKELYFEGNNPRRIFVEKTIQVDKESAKEGEYSTCLACSGPESSRTCVYSLGESQFVSVGQSWGWTQVEYFGRPRGSISLFVTGALCERNGDSNRIAFSDEMVSKLKQVLRDIVASEGRQAGPHIIRTEKFEGSDMYVVQCGQPQAGRTWYGQGPSRTLRMGIVPSKGYVCPFEEEYVDARPFVRFEAEDYRLEGADFWFPRRCRDVYFDESGSVLQETEYEITNVAINERATPRPFVVPIAARATVSDYRGGRGDSPSARYKSLTSQTIELREDGTVDLPSGGFQRMEVATRRRWEFPTFSAMACLVTINAVVFFALVGVVVRRLVVSRRNDRG